MTNSPKKRTPTSGTAHIKTRTPRPADLSQDAFEFITGIDDYKRKNMCSFLTDTQVLDVTHLMGWFPEGRRISGTPSEAELRIYTRARDIYRQENGRLFPNWSEVFDILQELGYRRLKAA